MMNIQINYSYYFQMRRVIPFLLYFCSVWPSTFCQLVDIVDVPLKSKYNNYVTLQNKYIIDVILLCETMC